MGADFFANDLVFFFLLIHAVRWVIYFVGKEYSPRGAGGGFVCFF